jgi:hypothetical protein
VTKTKGQRTLQQRLEAEYATRSTITMTTFVDAKTKAALATVQPLAMSITGSKAYTESAILRVLAELAVELDIDWEEELSAVAPGQEPREAIRTIIRRHLPRLAGDQQ